MRFRQVQVIGGKSPGQDWFRVALRAICAGSRDRLYAVGDTQVRIVEADGSVSRQWATSKPGLSVAEAADGRIWVGQEGQIEIFEPAGRPHDTWRDGERLGEVTSIGFIRDQVLAADARARCIRRYSAAGKWMNNIGDDTRMKGFLIPNGSLDFAVDPDNVIHAPNPGKHRVERYTPEGKLLGHIGRFDGVDPEGFPGCCNPTNVALGPGGRIYVTEKAEPRAKVLDSAGKLLSVIATTAFDPVSKNMDIALGSRGRVFVADPATLRILVFRQEAEA